MVARHSGQRKGPGQRKCGRKAVKPSHKGGTESGQIDQLDPNVQIKLLIAKDCHGQIRSKNGGGLRTHPLNDINR